VTNHPISITLILVADEGNLPMNRQASIPPATK